MDRDNIDNESVGGTTNQAGAAGSTSALESAVGEAEDSLQSLSPQAAVSAIESFEALLRGVNNPAIAPIASHLATLKQHLSSGNIDGAAVGRILTELGQQTSTAAGSLGAAGAPIARLGSQLSSAGTSLSGS
jgi:hypothetical protein